VFEQACYYHPPKELRDFIRKAAKIEPDRGKRQFLRAVSGFIYWLAPKVLRGEVTIRRTNDFHEMFSPHDAIKYFRQEREARKSS
jgi:hypothetical protein